jgi:hypothetical protein
MARLEALIDWRWSQHLKTFIGTNVKLKELHQKPEWKRIGRRLAEPGWMVYRELATKYANK